MGFRIEFRMRFFFVVEWAFVGVSMEYLGSSWESLVFGYSCFWCCHAERSDSVVKHLLILRRAQDDVGS